MEVGVGRRRSGYEHEATGVLLPDIGVWMCVDDDWSLDNVSKCKDVEARTLTEVLLSCLPLRKLLYSSNEFFF